VNKGSETSMRERERGGGVGGSEEEREAILAALVLSRSLRVIECFRRKNGKAFPPGAYL